MTGLEKIIQTIEEETNREANALIQKAKVQSDEILAEAKAESDAKVAQIVRAGEKKIARIQDALQSALVLQQRQRTLQTKQAVLNSVIEQAQKSLYALPADEYFLLLINLARHAAQNTAGIAYLNAHDRARMPQDFEAKLNESLSGGGALTVSETTRPIDGGIVLKYGDVEENCSFEAIFNARRDEFMDLIRNTLFA
ncbi:MAG: V-type ATP synthase subunit E [Christensenellales bacterium]